MARSRRGGDGEESSMGRKNHREINRRDLLRAAGALGAAAALPAPAFPQPRTLTVSVWGGLTQDAVNAHIQPEFEKGNRATLAYRLSAPSGRHSKLVAP